MLFERRTACGLRITCIACEQAICMIDKECLASVFRERSGEAPFSKRRHSNAFVVSLPGWKQVVQAAPAFNPQGILRISRPWPLQSMAANGRR